MGPFLIEVVLNGKLCRYPVQVPVSNFAFMQFEIVGKNGSLIIQKNHREVSDPFGDMLPPWFVVDGKLADKDFQEKIVTALKEHLSKAIDRPEGAGREKYRK